jgi:hypothetical protein
VLKDLAAFPPQASAVVKPAADGLVEAAAALKAQLGAVSPVTAVPSPKPRTVAKRIDPGSLAAYEAKLKARVPSALVAGRRLRFEIQMLAATVRISAMDAQGGLKVVMEGGGLMDLAWGQLAAADRLKLALALVENGIEAAPEDQALAAFFLLEANRPEQAERHLRGAGKEAEAVRAAFRVEEAPAADAAGPAPGTKAGS